MVKYFIERSDGSWLMEPDEPGSSPWTRDPLKAWQFDNTDNVAWGLDWIYRDSAAGLLALMIEDGLVAPGDLTITEHEFIPYTNDAEVLNGNKKPDVYLDNLNKDLYLRFGDEYYHRNHPEP